MRIPMVLASSVVLTATATLLTSAATAQEVTPKGPLPTAPSLKDGSWTASIAAPVVARARPGAGARVRLRGHTQWTLSPTSYMVTGAKDVKNVRWLRIQLPLRPNGRVAWVRSDQAVLRRTRTFIKVSTAGKRVDVFVGGKRARSFVASVGTGGTPTPKGLFAIYDPVPTGGQLGPYILVLTAHSNVLKTFMGGNGIVGIHGWPSTVGQAASHGCVRLSKRSVSALARYAKPGTPVFIV